MANQDIRRKLKHPLVDKLKRRAVNSQHKVRQYKLRRDRKFHSKHQTDKHTILIHRLNSTTLRSWRKFSKGTRWLTIYRRRVNQQARRESRMVSRTM